jgi:hypothetical protein
MAIAPLPNPEPSLNTLYIRRHGSGRLRPNPATPEYDAYLHWMHYAEGSAMAALILRITVGRLGHGGEPLKPRLDHEVASHLGYINNHKAGDLAVADDARRTISERFSLDRRVGDENALGGAHCHGSLLNGFCTDREPSSAQTSLKVYPRLSRSIINFGRKIRGLPSWQSFLLNDP